MITFKNRKITFKNRMITFKNRMITFKNLMITFKNRKIMFKRLTHFDYIHFIRSHPFTITFEVKKLTMQFTTTERGKRMVICIHSKKILQLTFNQGNVTLHRKGQCKATVKLTVTNDFVEQLNEHSHPPSQTKVEVIKIKTGIKRRAQTTHDTCQQILGAEYFLKCCCQSASNIQSNLSIADTCGSWKKYPLLPGVRYIEVFNISWRTGKNRYVNA